MKQTLELTDYQQLYELLFDAVLDAYNVNISYLDNHTKSKIWTLLRGSRKAAYALGYTQLVNRLEYFGEVIHLLLRKLNIGPGSNHVLRTYFERYFEVKRGQIYLKTVQHETDSSHQEQERSVGHNSSARGFNNPPQDGNANSINNTQSILKELEKINMRLIALDNKVDNVCGSIEHQFKTLTPFEKQLERLETVYSSIQELERRILSQEESLHSMVDKHCQITKFSLELSKTSKEVYELLRVMLLDSIISKTKN